MSFLNRRGLTESESWLVKQLLPIAVVLVLLIAGVVGLSVAHAHDNEPELEATPETAAMRYCQTAAVRGAWGAWSRHHGTPSTFVYIEREPLLAYFMAVDTKAEKDVPAAGIYTLIDLDINDRRYYEEFAFHGWKAMDRWIADGKDWPGFEIMVSVFYDNCKKELSEQK